MLLLVISDQRKVFRFLFKFSTQKVSGRFTFFLFMVDIKMAGIASLEKLMREFSNHYRSVGPSPGFIPKGGELVSAKFSDGAWYRGKIRRSSAVKKEAEVVFIDYGNQDTVPFSNIRPLDAKFRTLAGQAHEARLRLVNLIFSKIKRN